MIERFESGSRMSRAVVHAEIVYLAGLTADDTSLDIVGQTEDVLRKAEEKLAIGGTDKSRLLTATIWLRDIADFDKMNSVWEAWIDRGNPPARATCEAKLAHPDIRVEIIFTAAR